MGRLLDLAEHLASMALPSVPSAKNQKEPLQPAPIQAVPAVPLVSPKKLKVRNAAQFPDNIERHHCWHILRDGCPLCVMIGEPMTCHEALVAARWRWPDTQVQHQPPA